MGIFNPDGKKYRLIYRHKKSDTTVSPYLTDYLNLPAFFGHTVFNGFQCVCFA